jgi:hypothetical protein
MPSLIVVGKKEGGELPIGADVTVIGRDRGVTIELPDFQVSRRHALVIRTDDGCFVKDLGSRNGVLVNKAKVASRRQQRLRNGDVLTVGRTSIIFKDVTLDGAVSDAPNANGEGAALAVDKPGDAKVAEKPPEKAEAPRPPEKTLEKSPAKADPAPATVAPATVAPAEPASGVRRPRFQELAADDEPAAAGPSLRGDHVAMRQLLRRAERDRVFYRNLVLVLVGVLMLVLIALLFYQLGRRERGDDVQRSGRASSDAPPDGPGQRPQGGGVVRVGTAPVAVPLGHPGELDAHVFAESIAPLLVKTCATAGCHTSPGHGAGELALESKDDPDAVARNFESVKRFVVPGRPERSPLLSKPLRREEGGEGHGGGDVLTAESPAYQALKAWIARGAPVEPEEDHPRPRPAFSGTEDDKPSTGMGPGASATHKPFARIAASATAVAVGTPVSLDGATSNDPEGCELTFRWTLVDRPDASRAELSGALTSQAALTPDAPGKYLVILVASDATSSSEPTRLQIDAGTGAPASAPPVVKAARSETNAGASKGGPLRDDPIGRTYVREVYIDLLGRGPRPDEVAKALDHSREEVVTELLGRDELYQEWYEQELLYFLLIDNFRPAEDSADVAKRLKAKEITVRDAIQAIVIGQYFNQRNPGNDTFVTVVLEQLHGLKVQDPKNKRLLDAGKKMYDGYAATLFGKQGKNQADVVKIVVAERGFLEHLVRRSYRRVTGLDMDKDEVAKAADRLEKEESPGASFFELEKSWVLSPKYLERVPLLRAKSERAFIRTLFLDILGRTPEEEELRNARNALRSLADPGPLKAVLAKVLLDSNKTKVSLDGDAPGFVRNQFLRLLAREPKPGELSKFQQAVESGTSRETVVRAIVTSPEYEGY